MSSVTMQPIIVDGMVIANAPSATSGVGDARSHQNSWSESHSLQSGRSSTEGGSTTEVETKIQGHALTRTKGGSETATTGESSGWGLTINTSLVPNLVSEYEWDGGYLEGKPEVVRAIWMRWLHILGTAECFVTVRGHPSAFGVLIDFVEEVWPTGELKEFMARYVTRLIAGRKDYAFHPDRPHAAAASSVPSAPAPPQPPDGKPAGAGRKTESKPADSPWDAFG